MQEIVQKYYGETLTGAQDLQTNACCTDAGLPQLADEDHRQAVVYRGTISYHRHAFQLDIHHWIETGKQLPVCGNTWHMLHDTRFIEHFDFYGNFDQHSGIFPGCGIGIPFNLATSGEQKSGCY